jgi:hypothetical protein
MKSQDKFRYEEKFFFRTRVHIITDNGIRTVQNDFFISSDIVTNFENLGLQLQYKSDLKLFDIFIAIVFLILGTKGILKSSNDSILFAISIILIFAAIYWIIYALFNLTFVGSFYFSNSTKKDNGGFEIKSNYPASKELEIFIHEIRLKQKDIAVENLIKYIEDESTEDDVIRHLAHIKQTFPMTEEEVILLSKRIKNKLNKYKG